MYYAHKVIMMGKSVYYNASTYVVHNHNFSLKQIYSRYYLLGKFFKENPEFKKYGKTSSGLKLFLQVLKEILKKGDIKNLFKLIPNMAARYLGEKKGERK